MRLFVALDLPREVSGNLSTLIDRLRPLARLRWSQASNLHITTKFIGEWPEDGLNEITDALGKVSSGSIPIAIRGLGWFPNPHMPRVFWAAVRAPESLALLAKRTQDALFEVGVAREDRVYSPHLTLARVPQEKLDLGPLRREIASLPSVDFGEFTADKFHLYLSKPGPTGSTYLKLATFALEDLP